MIERKVITGMVKFKRTIWKRRIAAAGCVACMTAMLGTTIALAQEAEALEIALSDAGTTQSEVERLFTEAEREDGEPVYEVEFILGDYDYEYVIRNSDGMILEWKVEGRDVSDAAAELSLADADKAPDEGDASAEEETAGPKGSKVAADGTVLVGMEQAKEIVLAEAGENAEDVCFTSIKFEVGRRYYEYEIEYYQGRSEFECTVDAQTGEIIKFERD